VNEEMIVITDSEAGLGFLRLSGQESGRTIEVDSNPEVVADAIHHFRQLTDN